MGSTEINCTRVDPDFRFIRLSGASGGLKGRPHADPNSSCVKRLQVQRSACPPVCCITRSLFRATDYVRTEYQGGQVVFTIRQASKTLRCEVCGSARCSGRGARS